MKKIGIIVQMLSGGGAERAAANMSIDLSEFYDVHLMVFDCRNVTYKYGGTLHDIGLPASSNGLGKILHFFKRLMKVKKIKKTEKFDAVISLMEGANLVNVFTKQGETTIISERNIMSVLAASKLHRFLERLTLKKADSVVALSNGVKEDLIKNFGIGRKKVTTIYNSVDVEKFGKIREGVGTSDPDAPEIVTMGRLTKQKAQWHIFRAFGKVLKKYPKAKLTVLGDGELKQDFVKFIDALGISESVEFKGFMKNPHQIIRDADIFVFSSMVEGLANVILEALACGKAVVSTDCDAGPREILAPSTPALYRTKGIELGEYGILVPTTPNDSFDPANLTPSREEEMLADAMLRLIEDKDLRDRYEKLAPIRVKDFSPSKIIDDWKKLIG